jgi:hypothetical protein
MPCLHLTSKTTTAVPGVFLPIESLPYVQIGYALERPLPMLNYSKPYILHKTEHVLRTSASYQGKILADIIAHD